MRTHKPKSSIERLESRQLLSTTPAATTACTCPACMAAKAASLKDSTIPATIMPLSTMTALNKAAKTALRKVGASIYQSGFDLVNNAANQVDHIAAKSASAFSLELDAIRSYLSAAPQDGTQQTLTLALPSPNGSFQKFAVSAFNIAADGQTLDSIKTYRGVGIDDPTARIQLDTTDLGFHAQVLSDKGNWYVDPYWRANNGSYVSYAKADARTMTANLGAWSCDVIDGGSGSDDLIASVLGDGPEAAAFGSTLKTYRLAVGTSAAYSSAFGGSGGAQAAIVTAINRVTGVYEKELSIRLSLVFNTGVLIGQFTNASSEVNTATGKFNTLIGAANYDIGHVFQTSDGGVAGLGVVGGGSKGAGITGLPNPTGDAFYIDYVAHEMGHQFGANHTFNTSLDGNRSATHAYEPGSGVSIMAYAGLEGSDDIAGHSIANFNHDSIDAIRALITNSIPNVGVASSTGNNAPSVNAGVDYVIPTGTPFALTATGSDPDGNALSYDWQQRDLGAARTLQAADPATGPLFTQIAPLTSPTRNLPTLNSILGGFTGTTAGGSFAEAANLLGNGANSGNLAERLYAAARTSNWRVIARDNLGGVSSDDMVVTVVNTGAAFSITSLNSGTYASGSQQTLSWNVAGTTGNGINAANVNISYSTDGGQTFTNLVSNTANDGSELITIPNLATGTFRLKVQPTNNIFFDINNANLTISAPSTPTPTGTTLIALTDTGLSNSDNITNRNNSSAARTLSFTISSTVAGGLVEVLSDGVVIGSATASGSSTVVTTNGTTTISDGTHQITARQTVSGTGVSALSTAITLTIDTVAPTVTNSTFDFLDSQSISANFSESVGNIDAADLVVRNTSTNQTIPSSSFGVGSSSDSAGFYYNGILPNGNYTATFGGDIIDVAGNAVATSTLSFFFLQGDANRDRAVNFNDLVILAANYNTTGKNFSQANFNYDANGAVDFNDLVLLAANYNATLAAGRGVVAGSGNSFANDWARAQSSGTRAGVLGANTKATSTLSSRTSGMASMIGLMSESRIA